MKKKARNRVYLTGCQQAIGFLVCIPSRVDLDGNAVNLVYKQSFNTWTRRQASRQSDAPVYTLTLRHARTFIKINIFVWVADGTRTAQQFLI